MGIDPGRFKREPKKANKGAWADWLADSAPPAAVQQELRQKQKEAANTYTRRPTLPPAATPITPITPVNAQTSSPKPQPDGGVSIQISLPEFHKPDFKRLKTLYAQASTYAREHVSRRHIVTVSVIVALIGALWGSLAILKQVNDHRASQGAATATQGSTAKTVQAKPLFTPAVPSTKQQLVTPDGVNSQYDSAKGSYSFYDSINNKKFIVSEQKTPTTDAAKGAASQAAKQLHASTQLKSGWGTVYVVTSSTDNSQRLVAGVRDLLVFIQSTNKLSDDQWTAYINSLQ